MKVTFWGTRGSIPVSITAPDIRAKLITALDAAASLELASRERIEQFVDSLDFSIAGSFGGHSSCVEVAVDASTHAILDLGSGARPLAASLMRQAAGQPRTYHVFMSHLHWDHIMGFPFFTPVYIPGNRIVIHSCHPQVEEAFRRQQSAPCFPVEFDALGATIEFDVVEPDSPVRIAGFDAIATRQHHGNDSFGWRLTHGGKSVVYSTDCEHKLEDIESRRHFVEFFAGADLVVFDAMYSLAESISVKADWGHSSNIVGVELCQEAQARRLALFHHEPAYSDAQIASVLAETRRFEEITRGDGLPLDVFAAYDGLGIEL